MADQEESAEPQEVGDGQVAQKPKPDDYTPWCDHTSWDSKKHGRVCPCGAFIFDCGD